VPGGAPPSSREVSASRIGSTTSSAITPMVTPAWTARATTPQVSAPTHPEVCRSRMTASIY
jgi:hypothetical protein